MDEPVDSLPALAVLRLPSAELGLDRGIPLDSAKSTVWPKTGGCRRVLEFQEPGERYGPQPLP